MRIHAKIQRRGPQQVRLWGAWVLAYPEHPPRGYGTRGTLIGIYTRESTVEWIEADLLALGDVGSIEAQAYA